MKITLISTVSSPEDQGIRTISSSLKKARHTVKLVFMKLEENYYRLYTKKELKQLKNLCKGSGLIGISCFIATYPKAVQIIKYLGKELKIPIIFGGIHVTLSPENCIKDCDLLCVGEGEEAIVDVAKAIEDKKPLNNIKNIWIRKDNEITRNDVRDLVDDLDKLPYPDFDIEDHYILDKGGIRHFKEEDFKGDIMFLSGRGCPYGCTYCSNGRFNEIYKCHRKRIVRKHSVDYSINFLKKMKSKFKISHVDLRDDTFTTRDIGEIRNFCKAYKKHISLNYKCTVDARTITAEKVKELVDSGCDQITLGIQGSERVNREVYHRYITYESILKTGQILSKYKDKLAINYDLMATNPYDGPEDILEVFKLIRKLPKPFRLFPNNLTLFPGSQLYVKAVRDKIIKSIKDTGMDLNFYDRGRHILRKGKNIYLNTLLNLTRGLTTEDKYGSLKASILHRAIQDKYVKFFNDKNNVVIIFPYLLIGFDFIKYKILKKIYNKMPYKFKGWYINKRLGGKIFYNDAMIERGYKDFLKNERPPNSSVRH